MHPMLSGLNSTNIQSMGIGPIQGICVSAIQGSCMAIFYQEVVMQ